MPVELTFTAPTEQPQQDQPPNQAKVCSSCHVSLDSSAVYIHEADSTVVCRGCRERRQLARDTLFPAETQTHSLCLENDKPQDVEAEVDPLYPTRHPPDERVAEQVADITSPQSQNPPSEFEQSSYSRPLVTTKHSAKEVPCDITPTDDQAHASPSTVACTNYSSSLSPLIDITRLRVRPQSRHCLYPGASFQGTQKSGRNSYDVTVTIVDVDFSSSFLCGYLRIRGLTDDWPELTTYFDAEIIGSRYGFLTQNWSATEQEDMVHWSRFVAFRNVKNELKKPYLTISDRDRGAVFMRWKERFLVPDHRVQDISGASFAGFYYVCVDFNPPPVPPVRSACPQEISDASPPISSSVPSKARNPRSDSVIGSDRSTSPTPRTGVPTMNGFYFHQTSEPYQHLSLCYVPERTSSTFEFR